MMAIFRRQQRVRHFSRVEVLWIYIKFELFRSSAGNCKGSIGPDSSHACVFFIVPAVIKSERNAPKASTVCVCYPRMAPPLVVRGSCPDRHSQRIYFQKIAEV